MDGFLIRDQPLKVSNVPYSYSMLVGSAINMDEENGGYISSAEARNLLVQKFSMRGRFLLHQIRWHLKESMLCLQEEMMYLRFLLRCSF